MRTRAGAARTLHAVPGLRLDLRSHPQKTITSCASSRHLGFLQASLRAGTLNRRRFNGGSLDPNAATVVALQAGERRQLPPFRLPSLPADRLITIVVNAPTDDVARGT
jgi:hypothetical protein